MQYTSEMRAEDRRQANLRNLNAHQEARIAAAIWGRRYSEQHGGLMDFWDSLSDGDKNIARLIARDIRRAEPESR